MKKAKKVKIVLLGISGLILAAIVVLLIMFRHEIKALTTLKEREKGVYTMTYDGDYGFDEFLKIGAKSDKDIEKYVTKRLLKGLPIDLNISEGGCTAFVTKNEDGDVIYARNFVFPYSPFLQLHTKSDNGYESA